MIELRGPAGFDDRNVIRHGCQVWEHFGQFLAALSVSGEFEAGAEDCGVRADESVALSADDGGRDRFALEFGECRLVVEKLQLRRGTGHEEMDDCFGFWRGMGKGDGGRATGGAGGGFCEQRSQRDLTCANGAVLEEVSAGDIGRAGFHPVSSEGISPKVTNELDAVSLAGKLVTRQRTASFGVGAWHGVGVRVGEVGWSSGCDWCMMG